MPIQVLPPQLANQIAAGEVVERPASVVKELVENSLDAGATRIDIEIDKGGAKLIRIRDNGCGIGKDELALALARHATSKIMTLDDLEAISSLGFRGEALASISSVSRLTLTSRTAAQNEAWQAYAEGRDMAVTVKPAAHPVGTTLEVLDLFYNTPARRKFMRTEKTEFTHIDEIIRRIALARFDVAFSLSHNGKLMRQYRGVSDNSQRERRLGSICGTAFLSHALAIEWQHGDLSLRGWVADPAGSRAITDLQYCYVNGRMMRDRLINHAIRQAYQDKLGDNNQPAYVLYLEIDPHQVDVNVHPAKHEVRFHQSRLVHDFIYQGVISVLQETGVETLPTGEEDAPVERWQPENRQAAGGNHFSSPAATGNTTTGGTSPSDDYQTATSGAAQAGWQRQPPQYRKKEGAVYQQLLKTPAVSRVQESTPVTERINHASTAVAEGVQESPLSGHSQGFGRVLAVIRENYALLESGDRLMLIALPVAERWLKQVQLLPGDEGLKPQPLLIPLRIKMDKPEREVIGRHSTLLMQMGIELLVDGHHVTLRAVPLPLRQQNLQNLIPELLGYLARQQQDVSATQTAQWLARHTVTEHPHWNHSQSIALLTEVERLCPQWVKSPPSGLMQDIDIEPAMNALKYE
ncbi:DNA mismatch repair endonuclease MutL [Erwinia endophytica]|uniref:DNA mismatch repair endonuclease MutL n=1 Tax=Erwinia endophytica TaxID=1563158 RepID=UPI001265D7A7|nr:DNA mismatch repair endonuclease MutL [Erwinia endophytica]KAB8311919.1 DNA mismatch repair endonuclease MutL [Erwinia endophytica]